MLTIEQKRRAAGIVVFILPMVLVVLVNAFLGTPASVLADESQDPLAATMPILPPVTAPVWPDRTIAAAQHAASLRQKQFGQTPIYYPLPAPEVPVVADPVGPVATGQQEFRPNVQTIMGSPRGDTAIINGHIYSVGDTLRGTAWVIDSINARDRAITFRNDESERTLTINLGPVK